MGDSSGSDRCIDPTPRPPSGCAQTVDPAFCCLRDVLQAGRRCTSAMSWRAGGGGGAVPGSSRNARDSRKTLDTLACWVCLGDDFSYRGMAQMRGADNRLWSQRFAKVFRYAVSGNHRASVGIPARRFGLGTIPAGMRRSYISPNQTSCQTPVPLCRRAATQLFAARCATLCLGGPILVGSTSELLNVDVSELLHCPHMLPLQVICQYYFVFTDLYSAVDI